MELFPGFRQMRIKRGDIEINARIGGRGAPLLLLHGYPQTHVMWHKIAPRLAEKFTVVAADLRGYGDSSKPQGLPDHSNYSKREMALDQVEVMRLLGFERFFLAAHDRGARVAHRLALDHPERVQKLALLDIAPTHAMYENVSMGLARDYFHWYFLIQPAPFPETLIGPNAEFWLRTAFRLVSAAIPPAAFAEYLRCFRDPASIHATCEDYRAAASVDLEHHRADDAAGRKITCPLLVLWGTNGVVERYFKPLEEWRKSGSDVRGRGLPAGHFLAEEVPDLVYADLVEFF